MINLTSTHNELAEWFVKTYPDLVESMDASKHAYDQENINPFHYEDRVLSHTWLVFKLSEVFSPANHLVKWSSLLHYTGKPLSREVREYTIDFSGMTDEEIYEKYKDLVNEFVSLK